MAESDIIVMRQRDLKMFQMIHEVIEGMLRGMKPQKF